MNNDFISILNRMKERFENEADTREGTWTADNLQAVANELARMYSEDIETILPQAFVLTASGANLDKCCSDYGITRRIATAAEVVVTIKGDRGGYYGVQLFAGDIIFYVPESFTIENEDGVRVRAVCMTVGDIGNVPSGSITKSNASRITMVTNELAATGGYDEESDESLRERCLEHIRTPANSGNIAHYIQWAKEISGVAKVKVYDLARGPGTVDVILIADDNHTAPQGLIEAVENYIETVRPVGADVLVASGRAVDITVSADVITKNGYTAEGIAESFYEALKEHCKNIAFQSNIISYYSMINVLFDCPGIIDINSFMLNGETESITLQDREFPVAVTPIITATADTDGRQVDDVTE